MDPYVYDTVFILSAMCSFTLCSCVCMFLVEKYKTKKKKAAADAKKLETVRTNTVEESGSGCHRPNLNLTPSAPPLPLSSTAENIFQYLTSSSSGNSSNERNSTIGFSSQNGNSRAKRPKSNGNLLFSYTYMDDGGRARPIHNLPNFPGISPQTVPNYINNTNYSGPRPELATVREESQEQETEEVMSRDNSARSHDSRSRSHDQLQSCSSGANSAVVGSGSHDLNLDSNFEVILLSPSTPPPPYSEGNSIAIV